jgi:hypothetical protein
MTDHEQGHKPGGDTDRIEPPQFATAQQRVLALRSNFASPDALQRIEAALELDRIERVLLADVIVAQRQCEENSLDPQASLALAIAYRQMCDAGVLEGTCERHVLEQAVKLFARSIAPLEEPPLPLMQMLMDTAQRRGRTKLVARLRERLANMPGGGDAGAPARRVEPAAAAKEPTP